MISSVSLNSRDSLDEFLILYQTKDPQTKLILKKEREIINYLHSLGIQMKTDPLHKIQSYYKQHTIVFKQVINNDDDENNFSQSNSIGDLSTLNKTPETENDLLIIHNPFINRKNSHIHRKHSFEDHNQEIANSKDNNM